MNIQELSTFSLRDSLKFHDELNPALWDEHEQLKPEVREKLLQIAEDFQEYLGVDNLDLKDITLSGSNAAFSYNKHSDIDLHLVVDMPDDEVYRELFDAKKYAYNDQHDVKIKGSPVELYVQDANEEHYSQGIYSVMNDEWIDVPKKRSLDVDDSSVKNKFEDVKRHITDAINSDDFDTLSGVHKRIKAMRQCGLEKNGEFSIENLTFKMLRNEGWIEKLLNARNKAKDKMLSLAEKNKKKQKRIYGFSTPELLQSDVTNTWDGVSDSTQDFLNEDVTNTWDGVSDSTQQFLNEKDSESHKEVIKDFILFCKKYLKIAKLPKVTLKKDAKWSSEHKTFGYYNPNDNSLTINLAGRNIVDSLRTIGHELVHCKQFESVDMPTNSGETGSAAENHANSVAGILMREYGQLHPELFQMPVLAEASGYIPTAAQAHDPRFEMALSCDVHPGTLGRVANAFDLNTDSQGKPQIANPNGRVVRENCIEEQTLFESWQDFKSQEELIEIFDKEVVYDSVKDMIEKFHNRNKEYVYSPFTDVVQSPAMKSNDLFAVRGRNKKDKSMEYHLVSTRHENGKIGDSSQWNNEALKDAMKFVIEDATNFVNKGSRIKLMTDDAALYDQYLRIANLMTQRINRERQHGGEFQVIEAGKTNSIDGQYLDTILIRGTPTKKMESLRNDQTKTSYIPNDINKLTFESFDHYRRWCQSPKTNSNRNPMYHPNRYQGIFIDSKDLRETNDIFTKRKQQGKEFSNEFLSLDDRENVALKVGNKISVLSCIVAPTDKISRIELSGFVTPKEIANLLLSTDDKIDAIEFTDGTQYPEKAQETIVDNINLVNTVFFPDKHTADYAMTATELLLWGMEGKGWKIERYMSESADNLEESLWEELQNHKSGDNVNNFQKWFGNSKVVDDNGNPLRVYHGTAGDFPSFSSKFQGKTTGATSSKSGFFFTSSPTTAKSYADYAALNAKVQQLLDQADAAEKKGDWDLYDEKIQQAEELDASFGDPKNRAQGQSTIPVFLSIQNPIILDAQGENPSGIGGIDPLIKKAKSRGHDGVIIKNFDDSAGLFNDVSDHYIVFNANQIKSAIGNKGSYNPDSDEIVNENQNNFKSWFSGSKIVNPDGTPKIMYHGTHKDFSSFVKTAGSKAIFVSSDPKFAKDYAIGSGGNILPVYIRSVKPWDYLDDSDNQALQHYLGLSDEDIKWWQGFDEGELYMAAVRGKWDAIESDEFQKFLQSNDYDGFYVIENDARNLGVFNANQIKSAIGNKGSYNPDSDEIVDEAISKTGEYGKVVKIVKQSIVGAVQQFQKRYPEIRESNMSLKEHYSAMQPLLERSLGDNFNMYFDTPVRFEELSQGRGQYNNDGTITLSSDFTKTLTRTLVDALFDWSPEPASHDERLNKYVDISKFTEYEELAQDLFQTRPHAINDLVETFIHEYVHAEQHKRIAQKNTKTGKFMPNQYYSYLQRNRALFAKAVQNLETDEDWQAYLSSPQEITAHAHDLANKIIQGALFGQQIDNISPEEADISMKILKSTLQQAANYNVLPKYQQYDIFDRNNKQHRKIVNRFLKTVYQEVAAAIQTLQNKVQSGNLSESLGSPYPLNQGLNLDSVVSYTWKDENNLKGSIGFMRGGYDEDWEITFNVGGKFNITNKGDAFRIFATAKDAVKRFMTTPQGKGADRVYFSAKTSEPTRVKLYDKLAQMMVKNGFKLHHTEMEGNQKYYYLDTPNQGKEVKESLDNTLLEVLKNPVDHNSFSDLSDMVNSQNKGKAMSGHTNVMATPEMRKENTYIIRFMDNDRNIQYHICTLGMDGGQRKKASDVDPKIGLDALNIIFHDAKFYLEKKMPVLIIAPDNKRKHSYLKMATLLKNQVDSSLNIEDVGMITGVDGARGLGFKIVETQYNKLTGIDPSLAEAQTVAKMMPAVKLWKARVKIKQPNYIGYVEAQVTAPDMRTARNMLKALYNVPEHEVGSVTLVK